jgi:glycosyltransferase involved in cell wall biosynthesis
MDITSTTKAMINSFFFKKTNNEHPKSSTAVIVPSIWKGYSNDAISLVNFYDFNDNDLELSKALCMGNNGHIDIKAITWFIPEFDNPFWGGIHTILGFAAYAKEKKNMTSNFVIFGSFSAEKIHNLIMKAFPILKDEKIFILKSEVELTSLPETDVGICTLWTTAYYLLKFNKTKRKFYFIQDFEPLFYPAGSTSAQVEETYRFGFYGIANTISLKKIYEEGYGGKAGYFTPAVDTSIFYPSLNKKESKPYKVFFYGRPGHPRNGFELGITTLKKLKERMGDSVHIVTAGSSWDPKEIGLEGIVDNLGLMSFEDTAKLYRECDVALTMMFTRHPSYIPFELMASGCLVVTNYNPANTWMLHDGVNCMLSHASVSSLCDTLERAIKNSQKRDVVTGNAFNDICENYSNWYDEYEKIYRYICDPE